MYWSDVTSDTIHRANMDGSNEEIVASTNLIAVGKCDLRKKLHNLLSMIFRRCCF